MNNKTIDNKKEKWYDNKSLALMMLDNPIGIVGLFKRVKNKRYKIAICVIGALVLISFIVLLAVR